MGFPVEVHKILRRKKTLDVVIPQKEKKTSMFSASVVSLFVFIYRLKEQKGKQQHSSVCLSFATTSAATNGCFHY